MTESNEQNTQKTSSPAKAPRTQASRRAVYGFNVLIAIVVALGLAVLLNLIAHRGYQRVGASLKNWVRYDLTATRRYSLSEQTVNVLGELEEPFKLVGLFRGSNVHLRRLPRLMNEYAAYGEGVTAQHIRFDSDIKARQKLLKELAARFDDDLKPAREALQQLVGPSTETNTNGASNQATLATLSEQLNQAITPLKAALQSPEFANAQRKEQVRQITRLLQRRDPQRGDTPQSQRIRRQLEQPLPKYGELQSSLQSSLEQLDNLLQQAQSLFEKMSNAQDAVPAVAEQLLQANRSMKRAQNIVQQAVDALSSTSVPERYDEIRNDVMNNECVVILGPKQVKAIAVNELYRTNPTARRRGQASQAQQSFIGEEKLTGALLSMTMESSPLAVFVSTGQPPLGRRGQYTHVADRLRNANFEVTQWNPGARQMQRGGGSQAPTPNEGQKAVWIVVPSQQSRNPRMMMQQQGGQQQVAEHLRARLKAGDGVMLMMMLNPSAGMGAGDPLQSMIDSWGLQPQLDRLILSLQQHPSGRQMMRRRHNVQDWPKASPITGPLGGMQAQLSLLISPLRYEQKEGVTQHPLIRITGDNLWAESDLRGLNPNNLKVNDKTRQDSFVVGRAAEKDGARLVVTTAGPWASNSLAAAANSYLTPEGRIERGGLLYPANSELLINSVFWLSDQEQLIAPSPRTQDVRRVNPDLSDTTLAWFRGLAVGGLPVLALALGLGVWLVRRAD
jgi:hypothetical protein